MNDRQLIEDLLSALEYHTEQTRPIQFSKVAIEAAREYLRKPEQPAQQDLPDLIAGALGVSRGTAYDMMREALAEASPPDPCCWSGTRCDAQRKPLTEGEIERMWFQQADIPTAGQRIVGFARAIEAAHGITKGTK